LQSYFFSIDFPTADHMIGIGNKGFIADLMPRHPIYVSLLPKSAQDVIGQVHVNTAPALKLLENEGFIHRGYVDLFDAGPTVEAQLKQVKSVRSSHRCKVAIGEPSAGPVLAIANPQVAGFRATISELAQIDGDRIIITQAMADALQVKADDEVRYLNLERGAK
jgi:arginine N-succinyltransferase